MPGVPCVLRMRPPLPCPSWAFGRPGSHPAGWPSAPSSAASRAVISRVACLSRGGSCYHALGPHARGISRSLGGRDPWTGTSDLCRRTVLAATLELICYLPTIYARYDWQTLPVRHNLSRVLIGRSAHERRPGCVTEGPPTHYTNFLQTNGTLSISWPSKQIRQAPIHACCSTAIVRRKYDS